MVQVSHFVAKAPRLTKRPGEAALISEGGGLIHPTVSILCVLDDTF